VYYDPGVRAAPRDRAEFEAAEHVAVRRASGRTLEIDRVLAAQGLQRRVVVQVTDFAGVREFLLGSGRLATLPGLRAAGALRGLAHAELPLPCPPLPMYAIWHQRHQHDPMHRWLRAELDAVVAPALAAVLDKVQAWAPLPGDE